jgi:hypothetical protein
MFLSTLHNREEDGTSETPSALCGRGGKKRMFWRIG